MLTSLFMAKHVPWLSICKRKRFLCSDIANQLGCRTVKQQIDSRFFAEIKNPTEDSKEVITNPLNHVTTEKYREFDEIVEERYNQAVRSVLIEISSKKFYGQLCRFCDKFGLLNAFYYNTKSQRNFVLFELESQTAVKEMLKTATHSQNCTRHGLPARSQFLMFDETIKWDSSEAIAPKPQLSLISCPTETEAHVLKALVSCSTINEQIQLFYLKLSLSELTTRLRFLTARQIETAINGIFPTARVYPFGSSINGIGRKNSDLDIILMLDTSTQNGEQQPLVFHDELDDRNMVQSSLKAMIPIMRSWLPGVTNVRPILEARVPIIKFHQNFIDLEVDLSVGNMSGYYMSELLYMLGQIDDRVRVLAIFVKEWAEANDITNLSPGHWFTNFSLTCLVVFFLQQLEQPILPPINQIINAARPEDIRTCNDGTNCTFLRDLSLLQFETANKSSLETLLKEFFEFYAKLNFDEYSLSLNEGQLIEKKTLHAVHIINPLQNELNVCKNVNSIQLLEFKQKASIASTSLKTTARNGSKDWGIVSLLRRKENRFRVNNIYSQFNLVPNQKMKLFSVAKRRMEKRGINIKLKDHSKIDK